MCIQQENNRSTLARMSGPMKGLDYKETVMSRRWGSETGKFSTKQVENVHSSSL